MLEIGSVLDGKYKILNVIGRGGMSVVYQAVNERANKQWAVKEIRKDGVSNYEIVKRNLIAETDMLKRLKHSNLPNIVDVIDKDDTFLIVMDYIEGKPLNDILRRNGAQSQEDVIEWSKQLCDVLGYLHSRKPPIVYRDMKPANIMLKPDGTVTLIDFGTAREFKSGNVADTTCLGTRGYAAPEQFGGQGQTDGRTDIYCLGATMYHLVTGHNPATPPYEMYPIRQWNPMLSSGLEEIILKCIQLNPANRYQSAEELLYALEHIEYLEEETKKTQSQKWKIFVSAASMTLAMAAATIGFSIATASQQNSTYQSYINRAKSADSREERVSFCKSAIELDSAKADAFEILMKTYFGDTGTDEDVFKGADNKISSEEYEEFYKIAYKYFLESPEKYSGTDFADRIYYPLGRALYLSYEDGEQAKCQSYAISWLKRAAEYCSEEYKSLAESLSTIAETINSSTSNDRYSIVLN